MSTSPLGGNYLPPVTVGSMDCIAGIEANVSERNVFMESLQVLDLEVDAFQPHQYNTENIL